MDAILEAATRVLAERGYAAGTTNRIAHRAGVSIGSLYEYFPNKDAILIALVERHLDEGTEQVMRALEEPAEGPVPLADLLRRFVSAMVRLHARNPDLHRVLFEEAPHPPESHACALRLEEELAHTLESVLYRCPALGVEDPGTAAHFVVQTTEALAHRFVLHGLHDLSEQEFIEKVSRMLERYLSFPAEDRA